MKIKEYLNFDLLIDSLGDDKYQVRVVESPLGQATSTFTMPFSHIEIENFILKIGLNRGKVRSINELNIDKVSISKFGSTLYTALFSGDIENCFHSSYTSAKKSEKGLRIRLRLSNAPQLIDIPWEFLFDTLNKRYIGLSIHSPIIRTLDLPSYTDTLEVKEALRILVMISSPKNYPKLNIKREWQRIEEATVNLQKSGKVILDRLPIASLSSLQRALREQNYHVFHYIGHGGFDISKKEGVLVLEDSNGEGKLVSGSYLGTLLYDEDTIRLAILNSCNGARTTLTDPFSGVAQSLLQQGIPAVIAMQFEITDEAAISFADEFYSSLVGGYPVDAAMVESRKRIYSSNNEIEWATPVLYLSTNNTHIFKNKQKGKKVIIKKEDGVTPEEIEGRRTEPYSKLTIFVTLLALVMATLIIVIMIIQSSEIVVKNNILSKVTLNGNRACLLEKNGYVYCWSKGKRRNDVVGSLTDNALDISIGHYGEVCAILKKRKVRCWKEPGEKSKYITLPSGFTAVEFTRHIASPNICIVGKDHRVLCITDFREDKTDFLNFDFENKNQIKVFQSDSYCSLELDTHKVNCRLPIGDDYKKVVLSGRESPIIQFDFNLNHVCAVKQDGKLVCHNYWKDKTVMMDDFFGSNIKQVSMTLTSICVVKNDSNVICKTHENLQNLESIFPSDDFKPIPIGLTVEKLFGGTVNICAITTDDKVYCRDKKMLDELLKKYRWITEKI